MMAAAAAMATKTATGMETTTVTAIIKTPTMALTTVH
jgi:hypothetical protein